jgi:hypothetical protein
LQIPVLTGRLFSDGDGPDTQQVVVINQVFERKFIHRMNLVGRYLDKDTLIVEVSQADEELVGVASYRPGR